MAGGRRAGRRVLDAGCGEGILVQEFAGRIAIEGIDANIRRSGCSLDPSRRFPTQTARSIGRVPRRARAPGVSEQPRAGRTFRVLRPGGELLVSCPTAHLQSRVHFVLKGRLIRTASEYNIRAIAPRASTSRSAGRLGSSSQTSGHLSHGPVLTRWIRRHLADCSRSTGSVESLPVPAVLPEYSDVPENWRCGRDFASFRRTSRSTATGDVAIQVGTSPARFYVEYLSRTDYGILALLPVSRRGQALCFGGGGRSVHAVLGEWAPTARSGCPARCSFSSSR